MTTFRNPLADPREPVADPLWSADPSLKTAGISDPSDTFTGRTARIVRRLLVVWQGYGVVRSRDAVSNSIGRTIGGGSRWPRRRSWEPGRCRRRL